MIEVGIDLAETKKIARSMENPRFLQRVFSVDENEYLKTKKYSPQTAAGLFAAKEAFSKAMGTGLKGFSFTDIEVLQNQEGKPYLNLRGRALEIAKARGLSFSLSITHTKEYASAVVIAYL